MGMSFSDRFIGFFRNYLPSPFTLAVLLSLLTFALAWGLTEPRADLSEPHFLQLVGHWSGGIWDLLEFAMQMMLMLVLGHVLALSPIVGRLIDRSLVFCRDKATAAFTVTLLTLLFAFFNWGLGLIVGAILARKVADYAAQRNIAINYGLIGAAGYSGLMVWHGGISGSAPLKAAQPGHQFVELTAGQPIDISHTLGSAMNLSVAAALLVLLPLAMYLLAKRSPATVPSMPSPQTAAGPEEDQPDSPAERLDYSRIFSFATGGALFFLFLYQFAIHPGKVDVAAINPNLINLLLLSLCLLAHPHFKSMLKAVEEAIRGSAGIMIQFPLYAGIMGIMKGSGLVTLFSEGFVDISNETTFPLYTLMSAGAVNFFVPSGGGQWGVQGGIVLDAAAKLAVSPEALKAMAPEDILALQKAAQAKAIMALSYGDQLTNMMQPFWALPLLGITGLKARDILPFTLFLMLLGFAVYAAALLLF